MEHRIVRFHRLGPPGVLTLEPAAPPPPGPGEVLVAVAAIGLDNSEAQLRRGDYPMRDADLPSRIGRECFGHVMAVGEGVSGLAPGDAVCTIPAFDITRNGVYGTWALVPAAGVIRAPSGLSAIEAAAIWQAALTAWGPLVEHATAGPGVQVLVTAAASSVGLGAVQMASHLGAEVIATTRTAAKAEAIRAAGAAHVVVAPDGDLTEAVLAATGGKGFDLCLDPVAGPGVAALARAAAPGARIFLYGQLAAEPAPLPLIDLLRKGLTIRGYTLWEITLDPARRARAVDTIRGWVEGGALRPRIDRTFALDDIAAAHAWLEGGQQAGKIVVTVPAAGS